MSPSNSLKTLRKEAGVSNHIPVTHLNSPTIAETRDGMLFSVIQVEGVPFQTERNESINHWNSLLHRLVASLDENICLSVTVHRQKVDHNLEGNFLDETLQTINDAYMRRFQSRALYSNAIYITVLYRGLNSGKMGNSILGNPTINKHLDEFLSNEAYS